MLATLWKMRRQEIPMLQWQERFCIGVESIDKAHQELFRIINKLHSIMGIENSNRKWTAVEALKYVRNYTLKHFDDEEAYMRSIGFKGYEAHKAIHTNMREKVIPHLEAHLAREDYSVQSIGLFLTVFEKWLTQHIVGHDRDIMQKAVSNVEEQATGEKAEEKKSVTEQPVRAPGKTKSSAASPAASRGRNRIFWLLVPLLLVGAVYGAVELKNRIDRMDRLTGLKASIQEREAALAKLEAAIRTEQAVLAELKAETWGLRFTTFPDGAKGIILPEGMACECRGKVEGGEYGNSEGIILKRP